MPDPKADCSRTAVQSCCCFKQYEMPKQRSLHWADSGAHNVSLGLAGLHQSSADAATTPGCGQTGKQTSSLDVERTRQDLLLLPGAIMLRVRA
jgi:hypothetical protein